MESGVNIILSSVPSSFHSSHHLFLSLFPTLATTHICRSEGFLFLHDYPSLFNLSPSFLWHIVTFNASHVKAHFELTDLNLHCGFKDIDGDNVEYIVNATRLSVTVQEGM